MFIFISQKQIKAWFFNFDYFKFKKLKVLILNFHRSSLRTLINFLKSKFSKTNRQIFKVKNDSEGPRFTLRDNQRKNIDLQSRKT